MLIWGPTKILRLTQGGSNMYLTTIDSLVNETMRDLNRLAIGFEPTLRRLQLPQGQNGNQNGYPPFNLEKLDEHSYRITLAVAGFSMDDLDITVANDQLTISGVNSKTDDTHTYLHKGIASRNFSRSFVLADHVHVTSASLENGLLTVDLHHEIPEALKPRKIEISSKNVIESKPLSVG